MQAACLNGLRVEAKYYYRTASLTVLEYFTSGHANLVGRSSMFGSLTQSLERCCTPQAIHQAGSVTPSAMPLDLAISRSYVFVPEQTVFP